MKMYPADPSPQGGWHTLSPEAVARELATDLTTGLADSRLPQRQHRWGFNELPEPAAVSSLRLFVNQFTSVIVWVLLGAALLSGLLEDWVDAAAIMAIVVLNGLLGFVQEYRAEQALAALRQLSVATARCGRFRPANWSPAISLSWKRATAFRRMRDSCTQRAFRRRKRP
jgi:magnesium-transporting ATPase (P-type)